MKEQRNGRDAGNFLDLEYEEDLERMLAAGMREPAAIDGFLRLLAAATVYVFHAGALPERGGGGAIPVVSWRREEGLFTPCFTSLAAIRRSAEGRATFSPIFMPELLGMLGASRLVVNPGSSAAWEFAEAELARLRAYAPPYRLRRTRARPAREAAANGDLEGLFRAARGE